MSGIDAENLHLLGVEREFLEREYQVAMLGMSLDIRIELRGEEVALNHVAFQLAHVDAIGREATESLVQRGRHIAHPEHERGDRRAGIAAGPSRSTRAD